MEKKGKKAMDKKRRKSKKDDRGDGDKEPVLIGYALDVVSFGCFLLIF